MSANLNLPTLSENQASKEVTINDALGIIDAAITEIFVADCTSGSVVLTNSQFQRMGRINITNVSTTGRTVTVPAIKRSFFATSDAANSDSADLVCGSTTVTLAPGDVVFAFTDGTTDGLVAFLIVASSGLPYDLSFFVGGLPGSSEVVLDYVAVRSFTFPASLTGSFFKAGAASTGSVSFTLKKNGSSIGTVAFAASATGAATFASPVTFAAGDVLQVVAPVSSDATLADIAFAFKGTR